jgi:hypothetical protein
MKLYHATDLNNKDNIETCGLQPNATQATSHLPREQRHTTEGVFGFTTIEQAVGFAKDQPFDGGIAVFSFEFDNPEIDPEYEDGEESYFCKTDDALDAKIEMEIEY